MIHIIVILQTIQSLLMTDLYDSVRHLWWLSELLFASYAHDVVSQNRGLPL